MAHRLKMTLDGVEPPIWRRVALPSDLTLLDLHFVIQTAMGWENAHPHRFDIDGQAYSLGDNDSFTNAKDEMLAELAQVARPESRIRYDYDFGDGWQHTLVVEQVLDDPELTAPRCLDGARACPPEGSGGSRGYAVKLAALIRENEDEREQARDSLGEDFDPEPFDLDAVNRELALMFDAEPPPPKVELSAEEQRKARNKRKKQRAFRKP